MENEKWGSRFDQLKPIINYFPSVYYHPFENYLEFGIEMQDNIQMTSYQTVKYNNPPLQKWLNIVVVFSSTKISMTALHRFLERLKLGDSLPTRSA
jgi:hypothetical protein